MIVDHYVPEVPIISGLLKTEIVKTKLRKQDNVIFILAEEQECIVNKDQET